MYILSLTVQDPDSLQKLKLALKNHCHLSHPVVALVEKRQSGREMAVVETNAVINRRDDREGGRRDFKRKSNKIAEALKAKPRQTSHIPYFNERKMDLLSATRG